MSLTVTFESIKKLLKLISNKKILKQIMLISLRKFKTYSQPSPRTIDLEFLTITLP